ncbi:MAG: hypothetical protein ABH862_01120 [Candidatus Omnitrophota bacterium]
MLLKRYTKYSSIITFIIVAGLSFMPQNASAQKQSATDVELLALSIQKGLVPSKLDKDFFDKHSKDDVLLWIVFSRKDKAAVIDNLKKAYSKENFEVNKPTDYYVEEMNKLITNMILTENLTKTKHTKQLLPLFKIIIAIKEEG